MVLIKNQTLRASGNTLDPPSVHVKSPAGIRSLRGFGAWFAASLRQIKRRQGLHQYVNLSEATAERPAAMVA